MRILALEPYYGGSHRAFLDGWVAASDHDFTVLDLPARKWKWRMRHAAITFAEQVREHHEGGEGWDAVFASDMLNLAEWSGLVPPAVARLPKVAYFHENQVTYPVQVEKERDFHFGITNLTTALAADAVWFNSAFHREVFLAGLPSFFKGMPDHRPTHAATAIGAKATVQHPGIDPAPRRGARRPGPLRLVWAARWEHDKDPETLHHALVDLATRGVDFRVSVIGETFARKPAVFEQMAEDLAGRIDRWGFEESREDYLEALVEADVVVSTARHEFFGLSLAEAVAAGAYPLVPHRLAYPEVLAGLEPGEAFFYDGSAAGLCASLIRLAGRLADGRLWPGSPDAGRRLMDRYSWHRRAPRMDAAMAALLSDRDGA